MKRIFAVILMAILLAGCEGKFIKKNVPNTCGNTGWTLTTVHYGDAYIAVIPISEIVDGAEWRFVLDPGPDSGGVDYGDSTVKVRGKTAGGWFDEEEGTANTDGSIKVCIDSGSLSEGDIVFYDVEVVGLGTLDPRGRVIVRP